MASYIVEQPQNNNSGSFYSIQPTFSTTQICTQCEKCAMVPLTCVCSPVSWCDENCCDRNCQVVWRNCCGAIACVGVIVLIVLHPGT